MTILVGARNLDQGKQAAARLCGDGIDAQAVHLDGRGPRPLSRVYVPVASAPSVAPVLAYVATSLLSSSSTSATTRKQHARKSSNVSVLNAECATAGAFAEVSTAGATKRGVPGCEYGVLPVARRLTELGAPRRRILSAPAGEFDRADRATAPAFLLGEPDLVAAGFTGSLATAVARPLGRCCAPPLFWGFRPVPTVGRARLGESCFRWSARSGVAFGAGAVDVDAVVDVGVSVRRSEGVDSALEGFDGESFGAATCSAE